jgi:glycosyltransferase involved in cell wall biosynthesis
MPQRFASKQDLIDWMREPVREGDAPLNRFLLTVFQSRSDLQRTFGDLRGDAAIRFLCWVLSELQPPDEFLPPIEAIELLNAPGRSGSKWGVTRLLEQLYLGRPDLKRKFQDLDGDDGARYLVWVLRAGGRGHNLPREVLPEPDWLSDPAPRGQNWGINRFLHTLHDDSPAIRERFPDLDGSDGARFLEWARTEGVAAGEVPLSLIPTRGGEAHIEGTDAPGHSRKQSEEPEEVPWGVNVLGFLRAEFGIGEATRLLATGLEAVDVPVLRWPCGESLLDTFDHEGASAEPRALREPDVDPHMFNVIGMNGPELAEARKEFEPFRDRYTIGSWWWEVHDALPDDWLLGCTQVDEVWTASDHIARGLEPFVPVPVTTVKLPIVPPAAKSVPRAELGLPDGHLFLFTFDFFSSLERKNPIGVVRAFRRAFPAGSGAKLVLKSINGHRRKTKRELMRGAIGGHPDITLIDGLLPKDRMNAMVAACDCYVSLHRAEGFGIPLAQAMSLGKPAIATGYSGNLEFMRASNSYLVDATLTQIGDETGEYPTGGTWAEPDVDHAAALMRRVFEHPEEARERGARAAEHIARQHSPSAAGESMLKRLVELTTRTDRGDRPSALRDAELRARTA